MSKKILVIAPHPDDEVLGCGGSIARLVNEGNEVHIVIVTKGTDDLFSNSLIEECRNEAKKASDYLGVKKLHFLDGFPAAKLDTIPNYELNNILLEIIREIKPSILFIPHRKDIHKDHQLVHEAALVASRPLSRKYQPMQIMAYETLSETEWGFTSFMPNVFINISEQIDAKVNAMKLYKTQLKQFPHSRSIESIKSLAQYRGGTIMVHYAEAFMLVRHVVL